MPVYGSIHTKRKRKFSLMFEFFFCLFRLFFDLFAFASFTSYDSYLTSFPWPWISRTRKILATRKIKPSDGNLIVSRAAPLHPAHAQNMWSGHVLPSSLPVNLRESFLSSHERPFCGNSNKHLRLFRGSIRVFPKWSRIFTEFSEFMETDNQ